MKNVIVRKKLLLPSMAILASLGLSAQSMHISSGVKLVMVGSVNLVVNDMGLINEGTITPAHSTVTFTGSGITNNAGGNIAFFTGTTTATTFNNLSINKSAGDVQVNSPITVAGTLNLTSGNLRLNNTGIQLGNTGVLANESDQSHVTGSGSIASTAVFSPGVHVSPGNMGVEITPDSSIGTTITSRLIEVDPLAAGRTSIPRIFFFQPVNSKNATIKGTILYHYLDSELGAHSEGSLLLWSATAHSTTTVTDWMANIGSTIDVQKNVITENHTSGRRFVTASEASAGAVVTARAATSSSNVKAASFTAQVSPNPVASSFTLVVTGSEAKDDIVGLYDGAGHLLQKKQVHYAAGANYITWDLSTCVAGVYYLHFENGVSENVKVIKK